MKKTLEVIAVILTTLAVVSVSTASWFFFYQPNAPKTIQHYEINKFS
ncbi:MAG: cyclic lactone autoinducer peptide [Clostridiaceae bacterium]|jgi:cyclic lactone autoinducer peptide|nr:cyclic lactone autoinducer peptide [Clostridiaceae bacterium]